MGSLVDEYFLNSLNGDLKDIGYIELFELIGADLMLRHVSVVRYEYGGGVEKIVSTVTHNQVQTVFKTPIGSISQTVEYHSGTSRHKEYFIKDVDDIKIFSYIENHKRIIPDYESFIDIDKEIGDSGLATTSASSRP